MSVPPPDPWSGSSTPASFSPSWSRLGRSSSTSCRCSSPMWCCRPCRPCPPRRSSSGLPWSCSCRPGASAAGWWSSTAPEAVCARRTTAHASTRSVMGSPVSATTERSRRSSTLQLAIARERGHLARAADRRRRRPQDDQRRERPRRRGRGPPFGRPDRDRQPASRRSRVPDRRRRVRAPAARLRRRRRRGRREPPPRRSPQRQPRPERIVLDHRRHRGLSVAERRPPADDPPRRRGPVRRQASRPDQRPAVRPERATASPTTRAA